MTKDIEFEKAWNANETAIYYERRTPEGGWIYKKYKPSVYNLLVKRGMPRMRPCRYSRK